MKGIRFLKPLDIPVIGLAAALTLALAVMVYSGKSSASRVVIRSPDKTWFYPLNAEVQVDVAGAIGETVVQIHKGQVAIISSPCAGQTCVAAGALHKNGQWAACLPNRVFVLIEGAEAKSPFTDTEDTVDAACW